MTVKKSEKKLRDMITACLRKKAGHTYTAGDIVGLIRQDYPQYYAKKTKKGGIPFASDKEKDFQIKQEINREFHKVVYDKDHSGDFKVIVSPNSPRRALYDVKGKEGFEDIPPEEDLYPLLGQYLAGAFDMYSMRIVENKARKEKDSVSNKWLHPDVVGLQNITTGWHEEIKECVESSKNDKAKLWSFEVKRILDARTVRQSFFQAVSNSSWSHCGYLVAAGIDGPAQGELALLANFYGIGLIHLDFRDPSESRIVIPCRERATVDWAMANRLARVNTDAAHYFEQVSDFYRKTKIIKSKWTYTDDGAD
ncbi:MAG: hypothetical protein GDA50_07120 [Alphaproteobacteria bacterium GM202ARS2]|nr:hypothetical protein [Alphaproteobacteria bacterium GM202ARS2]